MAIEKSTCFSLDRETFNAIVKNSAIQRREKFEKFLGNIELFKTLDEYERTKLSDVLVP
jgi:cAMP-dependent protein kinase regulator